MAARRERTPPAQLEACVLRRYDWSESSLILEVFTRHHGRIALVARGAKKPSSGFRPVLLPLHIALIELIVDPACSLAFESEPEEPDVMDRPPRDTRAALFGAAAMWQAAGQGLLMLCGTALAYLASVTSQWGGHMTEAITAERTRSMVLMAFVVGNAALIFISKSGRAKPGGARTPINWVAVAVSALAVSAVALAIYWPWLATALRLQPLDGTSLLLAAVCGLPGLVVWAVRRLRP